MTVRSGRDAQEGLSGDYRLRVGGLPGASSVCNATYRRGSGGGREGAPHLKEAGEPAGPGQLHRHHE
eukprot:6373497-Pyramimonas_sp.AAC.1